MLDLEAVTRFFPAVFFTAIAAFYTARIILLGRQLGRSPIGTGAPGTMALRIHLRFRLFRIFIWAAMVARVIWPETDRLLGGFSFLERLPLMLMGDALLLATFLAILGFHVWMRAEWRSGIDEIGDTDLRLNGPFRWVRHPMFALVMLGQFGLFLAAPSCFTLVCLIVGVQTLRAQARLEDAWLARTQHPAWQQWAAVTPAWPWGYLGWANRSPLLLGPS